MLLVRLQSVLGEIERSVQRESKVIEDNRQLSEKVSSLEKECASLTLELKAAQNRYQQEVRSHQETERRGLVSKEEANLEVVKGEFAFCKLNYFLLLLCYIQHAICLGYWCKITPQKHHALAFLFYSFDFLFSGYSGQNIYSVLQLPVMYLSTCLFIFVSL